MARWSDDPDARAARSARPLRARLARRPFGAEDDRARLAGFPRGPRPRVELLRRRATPADTGRPARSRAPGSRPRPLRLPLGVGGAVARAGGRQGAVDPVLR